MLFLPLQRYDFAMATLNPPAAERNLVGTLVMAALVLVLAWQLAYWTWNFLAPASASAPATGHGDPIDLAVAARLFGGTASPSGSSSGLRLKGVVAPTPGVAASAIFSTGAARDISVFLGAEVRPGVTLVEVHPEYAVVSRAGVHERIDLEARKSVAASTRGPSRAAGFKLNVSRTGQTSFNFSRKELDEALRDPNQLNYLGQIGVPPGGGVRMEAAPPGSLAQKLGLQPGDVIRRVNGQVVASPGDLARLYQQFATLSAIQAEVQRSGMTVQLSYAIQP
jgi:general secretion pathway protein C